VPLVVAFVLASLVGHATGAAGAALAPWLGAAALCALVVTGRPRGVGVLVALAACALAGVGCGAAHRWQETACTTALLDEARRDSVVVVPEVDAVAGDRVPGHASLAWCTLRVNVRAGATLTGGEGYHVTAPLREGTRRPIAVLGDPRALPDAGDAIARLRARAARRIDARFGTDAPLVRALVVADVHDLDDAMRDRWARAGLVHALSVSGLHVGIVFGALVLAARAARAPPARAAALAMLGLAAYVLVIGAPAPAVRAAVMAGAVAAARARQRPVSPWAAIALGAWVPVLFDAAVPLDLGWQLSVGGIATLQCAGAAVTRLALSGGGWRPKLGRELLTGAIASIAAAPLVAWHMGLVSLVAPLTNIAAAPLFTLAQPTLFLALLLDPLGPPATIAAAAARPVLFLLDGVAKVGAAPAWSAVAVTPTLADVVLGGAIVVAGLASVARRHVGPPLVAGALAAALLVWTPVLPRPGAGALELHVLDVGQGDALALRTPRGRWILVDAGPGPPVAPDAGRRVVIPHVRRFGGAVAALVLTHADLDHIGGATTLVTRLGPERLVEPGFLAATGAYDALLDSADAHGVRWTAARPGLALDLDGVAVRVLAPDADWLATQSGPNDASTILRVEYGDVRLLLVGDAERAQEAHLLERLGPDALRADVLKVGHHGSRTSSTDAFLDAVRPRVALVSVGRGNTYGHPAPSVLAALAARGVAVFRTDVSGTLVLRTDGRTLSVRTATGTWSPSSSERDDRVGGGASSVR
jgi:competence protein ComEC